MLQGWHCPRTPGLCLVTDTRKCGNCARKLPSFTSAIRPNWSPTKVSLSFYFSLFPHPFLTKIFCQNHYIFHYNSLTAPLHILQMGRRCRRRSPCTWGGGAGGGHRAPRREGRQGDGVPQDVRPLPSVRVRFSVWIRIRRNQAASLTPGTSSSEAKAHLHI